jgi:hypothetical protein
MKKVVLFLFVAVIAAGAVWGQAPAPTPAFGVGDLTSAVDGVGFWDFFVDQTVSTEKRYSAGIFSSYADDFIWFTSWDAKIGTFLLLGGYPSNGNDVTQTTQLTTTPYKLNIGLARSSKSGYVGVYYGGNLVNARGTNTGLKGEDNVVWDKSEWVNRLAILYGKEGLGGIRFDMLMEGSEYENNYTDDKQDGEQTVKKAPQIALGWGNALKDGMELYAQLGFRFADMTVIANAEDKKTDTYWGDPADLDKNAKLALQAGIWIPMKSSENTESSFSVDFVMGNIFGASGKEEGAIGLTEGEFTQGGIFLIGADIGLKQVIKADEKFSFGFKPNITIGFTFDDTSSVTAAKGDYEKGDGTKTTLFELTAGVNFGIQYKINEKFNLYTGLGLDVFNWKAGGYSEGKDDKYDEDTNPNVKSSAWEVNGFNWRPETLHGGRLGFGLTFAPSKNIVIGTGLNTLLDKIVYFDFYNMRFGTALNQNSNDGTESGWLSRNFFGGLTFDLTITAKF